MPELRVLDKQGKSKELVVDKRTLDKKKNPPNVKSLKFARNLPIKCDDCPYRDKMEGGNGICVQYEKGSLCNIRKDVKKVIEEYESRNPDVILPLMEEEFMNNYMKLKTFESLEDMANELNPEVTKRISVLDKLGKTINEMKIKKQTIEVSETKTLSEDKKEQIRQMFRISQESSNEIS